MADAHTFDITSGLDLQEVDNAANQARRELGQRFDFKGLTFAIDLDRAKNEIVLAAPDPHKLAAIWEVLRAKLIRRQQPARNLVLGAIEAAAGGSVRQQVTLKQGIDAEAAKKIVRAIKDAKRKRIIGTIMADKVRVSGPSRDELQAAIAQLRADDFGLELTFGNFR